MVVRVVLFRVRPGVTEDGYQALLAAFKSAIANVPGLIGYHVGRRIDIGLETDGVGQAEANLGQFDYTLVYQFTSVGALRMYLRRPAVEELRRQLATVCESIVSGDYDA